MKFDPPRHGEGDRRAKRGGGGAHHPKVPPIVERARKLRREMNYPEVLLWQLRRSPMGIRFRPQHPIGLDYVADFYCARAKLVIEVDGLIHEQAGVAKSDTAKERFLRQRGLSIVRINASDVLADADEAASSILAFVSTPLHHRPSAGGPPPRQAGEDQEG